MEPLKMQSPNLVDANIEKIASLFPNCITEEMDESRTIRRVVDFDLLRQELSASLVEGPRERYTLNWPGKNEAIFTANAPIAKTLRPCKEESVDFENTKNIFIEGDNLDALKLLQETYLNKVKMIYIDPPYNTGNDFIYEDDFAEDTETFLQRSNQKDEHGNRLVANTEANGRFHSDWLTMLYPRLRLARNLLRDDGVIFISIDDNEIHNLRKICDDIFGENNFVGTFSWRSRTAKADVPFGISVDVEWIVTYAKENFMAGRQGERKYFKSEDYEDRWRLQDLTTNKTKEERPNSYFTMVNPRNGDKYPSGELRTWCVTTETFPQYYGAGKIVFPGDYDFLSIKRPAFRVFEQEDKQKAIQKYGSDDVKMSVSTYLPEKDIGRTEHGSKEIRELFGQPVFPYPKPTSLIKFFIENISDTDSLIVDFFAGSGTTADAVFQQNLADEGTRRIISVQLPEPLDPANKSQLAAANYCKSLNIPQTISEITKERIRRAGKKIKDMNSEKAKHLDIGFRVFKVDTSNMKDVYYTPDELKQDNLELFKDHIKSDRSPEDLLFQVFINWGLDLTLPIAKETIDGKTVFLVDTNALIACFDAGITEELVKKLAAHKPLRVVFRDDAFGSDSIKINVEQIFKSLSPGTEVKSI